MHYLLLLVFLDERFKFQLDICNGCHDVLMSMNLSDINISNIRGVNFCYIINGISKREVMCLLKKNANLNEKIEHNLFFLIVYKRWVKKL